MLAPNSEYAHMPAILRETKGRFARLRRRLVIFIGIALAFGAFAGLHHAADLGRIENEINRKKMSDLTAKPWSFFSALNVAGIQHELAADWPPLVRGAINGSQSRADIPGLAFGEKYRGWTITAIFHGAPTDPPEACELYSWHVASPVQIWDSPPRFWWTVEYARLTIFYLSPIVWFALVILALSVRGLGRRVWPYCLTAGLACSMTASMSTRFRPEKELKLVWSELHAGAALTILSPLVMIRRRRRVLIPGVCQTCRYDLTGNQSGICPECGTPTLVQRRRERTAVVEAIADRLDHVIAPAPAEEGAE